VARTSLTSSFSASFRRSSSKATSAASPVASPPATPERSTLPCVTLRIGLPSNSVSRSGQKASMPSDSSSTSTPSRGSLELRRLRQRRESSAG
jgi:hypothetical protein